MKEKKVEQKNIEQKEKKSSRKLKILENKVVVGIAAIVMGILITFIFTPLYNKSLKEKVKVVQVAKTIEKGQKITDEMVKVVEVGNYNLSDQLMKDQKEVIGKYAVTNMYEEEYLVSDRLSDTPLAEDEYLESLDGTKGAVSITLQSFASGLSGKLFPNDIVSIIVTDDKTTCIPPQLKYVKVLACTLEDGRDIDENTKSEADEDSDVVADTITVLANEDQAKLLANLEVTQKIHVELIYRGKEEIRDKYLKQQDKIIKQEKGESN